jgi:2-enoate reductase
MRTDPLVQKLVDSYGSWCQDACENRAGGTGRMTNELYPYTSLFSPIQVNKMTIKNRVVMAPMGNIDMCEETGRPNDKMLQYFFARAKGGTGLITTGLIPISHGVDSTVTELGKLSYFPRIDRSRTVMSGWRDLAQGCHVYGSKVFVQLTPGLGRVGNPQCLITQLKFPKSASFNPNFYIPEIPCMRLTGGQMGKIIKNAGQAAADAKASGLDGVYLHGHEGYLLEQCTNPAFNRRKLGRYADWQRFGVDLIKEIRKRVGAAYPIMYRIDLSLALNETYGEDMKNIKSLKKFTGGRLIADTLDYMDNLVKAGVDLFDVDLGCYDNWWLPHPPAGMPAGCFLEIARTAKTHFAEKGILSNAGLPVPVVAVGKLGYPDLAEKAIRDGDCDMIMLGRPLLADPEWCNKVYAGTVSAIRPCIGCQEGCINEFVDGGHPQCAVNPRTGFEDVLPEIPQKAEKVKKIGVVGAGPAGILFALTAARRGHTVDLIEMSDQVGGKVIPGSVPKVKYDFANYLKYLRDQVKKAQPLDNFTLKLKTEATNDWLKEQRYDAVVFATGTRNVTPPIPGMDKTRFVQATDLLMDEQLLAGAKKVVVVGGGVVGCETGYWLRYEKGCDVTVVEMLPHLMYGACTANRGHLIYYMKRAGVRLLNCAKVTGFDEGKVMISRNISGGVPNPYNTWQPILPENIENPLAKKMGPETAEETLDADLVVLAMGGKSDDGQFFSAQKAVVAPELYNIGDSFAPGRVLEANRAAYNLALRI